MSAPLKAEDLWPLVQKLPHGEQIRLAKWALMAASRQPTGDADDDAYVVAPPGEGEFSSDDDPLAWEAGGWENVDASR